MSSPGDHSRNGDGANDGLPLSLSLSASEPQSQAAVAQENIVTPQASSQSCPTEPGRISSDNGVDGGLSFDEQAEAADTSGPIFDDAELKAQETTDALVRPPSIENDDASESESVTKVEKNINVNTHDREAERKVERGGHGSLTSSIRMSQKISIENPERQISMKLEQVENNAAAADNDELCVSVGHQVCSYDKEPSAADAGETSDLFCDNIEGSTNEALSHPAGDGGEDGEVITATSTWTKQRNSPDSGDVGAVQVDEQAPQLNRRFFRGLRRASIVARNRMRRRARARRGSQDDDGRGSETEGRGDGSTQEIPASVHSQGRPSRGTGIRESMVRALDEFIHASPQETLVSAHLVVEDEKEVGEAVVAERMGWFERKGKTCGPIMIILVVVLVVSLSAAVGLIINWKKRMDAFTGSEPSETPSIKPSLQPSSPPSYGPSLQPSSLPSHDPRPTLEIIQTRGSVRCGVRNAKDPQGFQFELCRAIAAVLLGNPDSIELIPGNLRNLRDRAVDFSAFGWEDTIEREIKEGITGAGFAFSSPIYYDGMAYFGNKSYVECAEQLTLHDACSTLRICVGVRTTHKDFVQSSFPSDFIEVVKRVGTLGLKLLHNGTCNVVVNHRSYLLTIESPGYREKGYIVGDKLLLNVPLAAVTRTDDYEFSSIINWIVNTLFYGEEKGLTKDSSRCLKDTNLTARVSDLNFLNSVFCVGNYGEIFGEDRHIMNQVNNGTTGMLYAIPFGDLGTEHENHASDDALLSKLRRQGSLNCGVVVPDGFPGIITDSYGLAGLNIDYCRTLAAALFNGNSEAVSILPFPENDGSSFAALLNRTIDALAGGSSQWKHHFKMSPSITSFRFSTPYYYGNETADGDMNFFSMVTREKDLLFSLFVKCVVLATIYAQAHQIMRVNGKDMPLISSFGGNFNWALRHAISYGGNYDEMYTRNFGYVDEKDRGRNVVNSNTGPQIHSLPGLDAVLQYSRDGTLFQHSDHDHEF